ncbi:MAG: hypothetical protein IT436_14665 [Phycisphaerales bacterium]|nr:hypothetical protein [Phycisphaerales bacterium]
MNQLASLRRFTTVVADTGDVEPIGQYRPRDATTNPTLIYQAAQRAAYRHLLEDALRQDASVGSDTRRLEQFVREFQQSCRPVAAAAD